MLNKIEACTTLTWPAGHYDRASANNYRTRSCVDLTLNFMIFCLYCRSRVLEQVPAGKQQKSFSGSDSRGLEIYNGNIMTDTIGNTVEPESNQKEENTLT